MKQLFILFTLLVLSGCGGDPYEKFYGTWEKEGGKGKYSRVTKIEKSGETILYIRSVFDNSKPEVITVLDGKLSMLGFIPFGVSDDGQTLYFDKQTYKKVGEERLSQITAIKAQEQKNRDMCNILIKEARAEIDTLKTNDRKSLKPKYEPKFKAIDGCNIPFLMFGL